MTRILFETGSTCIGGAERVLLRIANGLRSLRPTWKLDCVVLGERGGLDEEYNQAFNRVWSGPPHYANSWARIAELVSLVGYDICHCIDSFDLTAMAAKLSPKTHFVQNVFPNVRTSPFAPSKAWLETRHPYSAIVSEFGANVGRILPPLRSPYLRVEIPNGIDTAFWNPGIPTRDRDIDVIWCARTDKEKGIEQAMELVPLLCEAGVEYRMVTSETDGPQEQLMQLVNAWPCKFGLHSTLTPVRLRGLFRRSKVFLSTSTVEGMPATPLEAAACGCWPYVPNIDGLTDVFAEYPEFRYASGTSAVDIATRIKQLVLGEYGVRWMAEEDAVAIAKRYAVSAMVDRYLVLYEKLLSVAL